MLEMGNPSRSIPRTIIDITHPVLHPELKRGTRHVVCEEERMLRVMLRPRWVLALLGALIVAAGFAWLGHWQFERALTSATVAPRPTEEPVALHSIIAPNSPVRSTSDGRMVTTAGQFVAADFDVVTNRLNRGEKGYWVVGHLATEAPDATEPSLAIALGWTADQETAFEVAQTLRAEATHSHSFAGRFVATEAPQVPKNTTNQREMTTMSVAALVNRWTESGSHDVYGGYLVASNPPPGLAAIDSPAPQPEVALNWLNVFYAAEWALFAGVAVFLWYRLARDAFERERERDGEARAH
jgi:surfeit locus 1 family protein